MDSLIIIACLVAAILHVALFFKVWAMCDDIARIDKRQASQVISTTMDELIYLCRTHDPDFNRALVRSVYKDLACADIQSWGKDAIEQEYANRLEVWHKCCEHYGWAFPELFSEYDTYKKFREHFHYSGIF